MARAVFSLPASVRHYLLFLALVCSITLSSLFIYIQSEKLLSAEKAHQRTAEELQNKISDHSLFLHNIVKKAAAIKTRNTQVNNPHSGLLGRIRESVDQKIEILENRTAALKMFNNVKNNKNSVEVGRAVIDRTLNYNVHLFYYLWWGNPESDGKYIHWNHRYMPHWDMEESNLWPRGVHAPPDDIGSNFFPALGPYSSSDPKVIDIHMQQVQVSGAGVLVVSWYPPGQADDNGQPVDQLLPLLLDSAHTHGVKIAIHIEVYENRNGATLNKDIKYIMDSYGSHPAFYARKVGDRQLPVYYIFGSYLIHPRQWAEALKPGGRHSLRGTRYDAIFLGHYVGPEDERRLLAAGFDGFYTYFAANGFTEGSLWSNWKSMAAFAKKNRLLFVPSVGPGHVDTRIVPWNEAATRERLQGKYFRDSFQAALDAKVEIISVTSFNEWHAGTQVEPAVPKMIKDFKYEDYAPHAPDFYLKLLKEYVNRFSAVQPSDT